MIKETIAISIKVKDDQYDIRFHSALSEHHNIDHTQMIIAKDKPDVICKIAEYVQDHLIKI